MKKIVLVLLLLFTLVGCDDCETNPFKECDPTPTPTSTPTPIINGPDDDPCEGFLLCDQLTGATGTTGQQFGGALTQEGYKPGKGTNHILYRLPHTVSNGYIEVEVKGMDTGRIPSSGDDKDHGFLAMYDGRGLGGEPIAYSDDFKQNYFRWNIHWRGDSNVLKCVLTCASPSRANDGRAVFPPVTDSHHHNRDWSEEPSGSGFNWDPNQWYTLRVAWSNGNFSVSVNGSTIWTASGPYPYAPVDHRIWLGSAPGKYSSKLSDVVYRNFRVKEN